MDSEDLPATTQVSAMETPLDQAQEEAIPLLRAESGKWIVLSWAESLLHLGFCLGLGLSRHGSWLGVLQS